MLIEKRHNDAAHKAHIEIEVIHRKERGKREAAHAHYFSPVSYTHLALLHELHYLFIYIDKGLIPAAVAHIV